MRRTRTSCKLLAAALILIMSTSCAMPSGAELEPRDAGVEAQGSLSSSTPEKHQRQVFAMDTVMLLTAYGEQAEAALEAAEARLYELEADLDPEQEGGSVHALNLGAGGSVEVSEDCYNIMSTTIDYWKRTDGALDPGLYPLSKLWGFIDGDYRVPSQDEIGYLLAAKDTAGISLGEDGRTAFVPAGTELSLGAVAKGYAAQQVTELMADMGVQSAILSLGGNVQTLGESKPDGSLWQVAVQSPDDSGNYAGLLSVGQAAVVTSGGYQRYFVQDGVTYIHILDPVTGRPVANDLLSVTVVTDDGARADALSTALFVMGRDGALSFHAQEGGFELVLITTDDTVVVTPGLRDAFTETEAGFTYDYPG